jgi:outer membrane protein insertion porin family
MRYLLILISFFCFHNSLVARWFNYGHEGKSCFSSQGDTSFFLKDVILYSDIPFASHDFFSSTGLKLKKSASMLDVETACFYLKQRNRFKKILFKIKEGEDGSVLTFKLQAHWIVSHVAINNLWLGKELLKQRYLIRPGEVFDKDKHFQSLRRYESYFRKRGYLGATVSDELKYKKNNKTVAVSIRIHKGPRFGVRDVKTLVEGVGDEKIVAFVQRFLKKRLKHRIYKSKLINEVTRDLKFNLLRYGFPLSTVQMKEKKVSRSGVLLEFTINVPSESCFFIEGNERFSYEQLIALIARDQALLWHLSAPILVNVIKQWYRSHGFLQSDVTVNHSENGWRIIIKEGPRIKLRDIVFFGVQSVSNDELRSFFKMLLLQDHLDEERLNNACEAVIDFYMKQGFWNVEIEDREFEKRGDGHVLKLYVSEGKRRELQKVSVQSDVFFAEQKELEKLLNNNVPCHFDLQLFDLQKDQIVAFLDRREIEVILQPLFDEDATFIELVWDMKKKEEPAVFGNTVITGIPGMSKKKVRGELAYKSGTSWNRCELDKTFKNLRELSVFESIRLYPSPVRDPQGRRPVIVDLVADDPLELQARLGFLGGNRARANTYKVGGSVLYKNITNHADTFSCNVDITRFWRDISAHYMVPHVGGAPLFADVQIMERKYDQLCYTGCQSRLYTISEMGGMCNLQYKGRSFLADVKGGWKKIEIYNLFEDAARAICFSPFLIGYSEPFFILEPQLTVEHVDNTMNPTLGFISRLYVHAKFPLDLHATRLVRCLFEQSFFVPFTSQLVGAVRARVGHIFSPSFERLLPSERFYLGGPCTVRSYQQDFVAPVASYKEKGVTQWAPQGSRTMLNLNCELRCSLNKNLGVVIFYDNGFLRDEASSARCFCFGHAIGGGFRYLTPLGPLRFDIGWKGKYYPADRSSLAWFLSVGHAF